MKNMQTSHEYVSEIKPKYLQIYHVLKPVNFCDITISIYGELMRWPIMKALFGGINCRTLARIHNKYCKKKLITIKI